MGEQTLLDEELFNTFQKMTVSEEDVNILLLGETGVGKSTFINSFANYLEYKTFDIAEKNKVRCLIPAKFTVTNEDLEERVVHIGSDDNENATMAASATLETRSYVFPLNKDGINRIRLIDTPGIGDTRGIDQDNNNMENILAYISNLENLHAICFLLKPNNARLTVMFHYCIKQLLSRLEKSASRNVIFLFTNTRSSFYKPGDTTTALKKILKDIESKPPHVNIKFEKHNVFCLDNESFRYMVATRSGIRLGNKDSFAQSWDHSVKECWRMIYFITGRGSSKVKIFPHKVKNTLSVNEARRVILQLSKPLADIADVINDNIITLDRHNKALRIDNQSITQLKANLYVPVVNLRVKELSEPTTVCTEAKCSEVYTVGTIKKYHYKQRCHDPCYLQNVPKEIIGSPELRSCWAMSGSKCKICSCDFSSHMHIYYVSETFDDKIDNVGVKAQIKDRETALQQTKNMIATIEARKLEYEEEKETIIKTMATFAYFLQHNAIAPYNDAYKGYIEYLIDREKSNGDDCDFQAIRYHEELLKRYGEEKQILEDAVSSASGVHSRVTAQSVFDSVLALYDLSHTGQQIRELYQKQTTNQTKEHQNTEIVLDSVGNHLQQHKRKEKKQQNKRQHNPNTQKNRNYNKGQPNPRQTNAPNYNVLRNQYQHQNNPQGFQGPPSRFYPNQGFAGHGYPNYQDPPRHFQNQNFFNGPPIYQSYTGHPDNFSNYATQQHSNFENPGFHNQPRKFDQNVTDHPEMHGKNNYSKYEEWKRHAGTNALRQNNFDSEINDPKFDDWLQNMMGNNQDNHSVQSKQNNWRTENISTEEESDESSDLNTRAADSDEDEDFKDFMKKNNLEYLVKSSDKHAYVSDNMNKTRHNNNMSKMNSEDKPRDIKYQKKGKNLNNESGGGGGGSLLKNILDKFM